MAITLGVKGLISVTTYKPVSLYLVINFTGNGLERRFATWNCQVVERLF